MAAPKGYTIGLGFKGSLTSRPRFTAVIEIERTRGPDYVHRLPICCAWYQPNGDANRGNLRVKCSIQTMLLFQHEIC